MYAIRQHETGPAEVLQYQEVPDPKPGVGQVRIEVAAAGVHLIDTTIRAGTGKQPFGRPELPMTPGREIAGTVDAVGEAVDESWLGRRVVGHLGIASGGYAELAVRETEALHQIPESVDFASAVAMIGTGRTAVGIAELAEIDSSDVVVVTSAAGGVGSLLVQYASARGATVVGLAGGADKTATVSRLACRVIAIDYTARDWPTQVHRALQGREPSLLLDGVGGAAARAAFELLGVAGRIVMFGWSSGSPMELTATDLFDRTLTAKVGLGAALTGRHGLRGLETMALRALSQGEWRPLVQRFGLSQAGIAHAALENRETVGKVVLEP